MLHVKAVSVQVGTSSLRAQRSNPEANLWIASSLTLLAMTCWNIICTGLNKNRSKTVPQSKERFQRNPQSRGFTLVEVLVIVAIVAILAAIAYPSYFAFLQRTHRTDATRALMEAGAAMERYFSQRQTYVGATLGTGANVVYSDISPERFYNLSFAKASTATAYWLVATPVGSQASDKCGNFTYNSLSVRGVSGTLTVQTCWRMK
jgi:type IV pilus assembly protein PilE